MSPNNYWEGQYLSLLLISILFITAFSAYYLIIGSGSLRNKLVRALPHETFSVRWNMFTRLLGFALFGVIPGLVMLLTIDKPLSEYGISFSHQTATLSYIFGLSALVILVNYFAARTPQNLKVYPQIRVKQWDGKLLVLNALTWMAYLLGYEFIFRGLLLFGLLPYFDPWIVIVLNALLYAIVHIPKGKRETLAAFPFGIILCLICLETGNLWVAFFVHSALAISNDMFSIKYQSEMEFVIKV